MCGYWAIQCSPTYYVWVLGHLGDELCPGDEVGRHLVQVSGRLCLHLSRLPHCLLLSTEIRTQVRERERERDAHTHTLHIETPPSNSMLSNLFLGVLVIILLRERETERERQRERERERERYRERERDAHTHYILKHHHLTPCYQNTR